jgi:hypothetical protein
MTVNKLNRALFFATMLKNVFLYKNIRILNEINDEKSKDKTIADILHDKKAKDKAHQVFLKLLAKHNNRT